MSGCYVFLDIDLNDSRARYRRACQFVEANSIKYGLSSDNLKELGGRELKSVQGFFENDYEWSSKGSIRVRPQPSNRLVIELNTVESPLATENFLSLCTGEKGKSKGSGLLLSYIGSRFHRYVPAGERGTGLGILQGGDITFGNGTGGESIWGKKFKDDVNGLKLKHDKRGVVSMGNGGKNSNTSQFFICLKESGSPACDKKHVVLGQIIHGFDTLDLIEKMIAQEEGARDSTVFGGSSGEEPPVEITVTASGRWRDVDLQQGFWDHDDVFKAFAHSDDRKGIAPRAVFADKGAVKES
jgi:peptidylprolyl isomerase